MEMSMTMELLLDKCEGIEEGMVLIFCLQGNENAGPMYIYNMAAYVRPGVLVKWRDPVRGKDDRICLPRSVRNEEDFREVIELIASRKGLRTEKLEEEIPLGPAYRLIKQVS